MIKEEEKLHFSYECKANQTDAEIAANEKLQQLKNGLVTPLYNVTIHDFYRNCNRLKETQLYKMLDKMPKGGLHHIHTTAAPNVDVYIKLTYDPVTFYNEREGLFKVFPDFKKEDGYEPCNKLREWFDSPEEYDERLRQQIMLIREEQYGLESHDIWGYFQHKFARVAGLGKYAPFFRILLKASIEDALAQNIDIIEFRHTSGSLFDEQKNKLSVLQELELIDAVR